MTKYYLISSEDVGPNDRDSTGSIKGDTCVMSITTSQGKTNMSHEERSDGWLGTTNDLSVNAFGEYNSLDAARAIAHKMGYTETYVPPDDDYIETDVVEEWITPAAARDDWDAGDWFDGLGRNGTCDEYKITVDTTDEQIFKISKECEADAESDNANIHGAYEYLLELRDELIEDEE